MPSVCYVFTNRINYYINTCSTQTFRLVFSKVCYNFNRLVKLSFLMGRETPLSNKISHITTVALFSKFICLKEYISFNKLQIFSFVNIAYISNKTMKKKTVNL